MHDKKLSKLFQKKIKNMCFHSKQSKDAKTLEKRFKAKLKTKYLVVNAERFNGFTFPKTPVITNANNQEIQLFN